MTDEQRVPVEDDGQAQCMTLEDWKHWMDFTTYWVGKIDPNEFDEEVPIDVGDEN